MYSGVIEYTLTSTFFHFVLMYVFRPLYLVTQPLAFFLHSVCKGYTLSNLNKKLMSGFFFTKPFFEAGTGEKASLFFYNELYSTWVV